MVSTLVEMRLLWDGRIWHHLQWLLSLLWDELLVHEWILDAWVRLDEPVLADLEVVVLELIHSERVIVALVEVAQLRRFLGNLGSWPSSRVCISCLQAELGRVHVVFLSSL